MAKGHQLESEDILGSVKEGLSKAPTQPPTPLTNAEGAPQLIEGSFHGSLEEAANLLLSIIPTSVRDYACELADITLKIPRWQLLLGSMMAQQESGNLAAPSIDPGWRQVELLIKESICQYCKKSFPPKHSGQKYCSNQCGDKARGEAIKAQNKMRDEIRKREEQAEREAGLRT